MNLLSLHNCFQFCDLIPEGWNHFGIIGYSHEKLLEKQKREGKFI